MVHQRKTDQSETQKNRLPVVCKSLLICAKQGIALRGHRDEHDDFTELVHIDPKTNHETILGDKNTGNFRQMMWFRQDAGDSNTTSVRHQRAKYTSHTIQDELLTLMAGQVTINLVADVNKSPFFSLIADKTTDISTGEQLCVAIRYLSYDEGSTPSIQERFLQFVKIESLTGRSESTNPSIGL